MMTYNDIIFVRLAGGRSFSLFFSARILPLSESIRMYDLAFKKGGAGVIRGAVFGLGFVICVDLIGGLASNVAIGSTSVRMKKICLRFSVFRFMLLSEVVRSAILIEVLQSLDLAIARINLIDSNIYNDTSKMSI